MKRHTGQRGRFKFRCADCRAESWFTWIERERAAGIRCTACGSRFLDPVSGYAAEKIAETRDIGIEREAYEDKRMGKERA